LAGLKRSNIFTYAVALFIFCYHLAALIKFVGLPTHRSAGTQGHGHRHTDTKSIWGPRATKPFPHHSFGVANLIAFFQVCGERLVLQFFYPRNLALLIMPRPPSNAQSNDFDLYLWLWQEVLIKLFPQIILWSRIVWLNCLTLIMNSPFFFDLLPFFWLCNYWTMQIFVLFENVSAFQLWNRACSEMEMSSQIFCGYFVNSFLYFPIHPWQIKCTEILSNTF